MATASLPYFIARPTARRHYTVRFVAEMLGRVAIPVSDPGGALLAWGTNAHGPGGLAIPDRPGDVVWADLIYGRLAPEMMVPELPFDLLGAVGRLLTDEVNASPPPGALDRHDRLSLAASFQGRMSLADVPLVDVYVDALRAMLAGSGAPPVVALWPEGKRAAIGLTHDVDRPFKWALLRSFREGRLPRAAVLPAYLAKVVREAGERARRGPRDDFWLFEPLMRVELDRRVRSTFFLASMPIHGRWGARFDVDYDLSWPRFRDVFAMAEREGFEIGLHASYGAHSSAERTREEKRWLEDAVGRPVIGLRHHYFHLGPDPAATLRFHEAAGFRYDASIAFNDDPGFRRSVALPFHPWDESLGRPLRTLQLPTFVMDGALFYGGADIDAAVRRAWGLVERIAELGGLGVIDWHVRTALPANREFRDWGTVFLELLDRLVADSTIWVAGTGEIADWISARADRLRSGELGTGAEAGPA